MCLIPNLRNLLWINPQDISDVGLKTEFSEKINLKLQRVINIWKVKASDNKIDKSLQKSHCLISSLTIKGCVRVSVTSRHLIIFDLNTPSKGSDTDINI